MSPFIPVKINSSFSSKGHGRSLCDLSMHLSPKASNILIEVPGSLEGEEVTVELGKIRKGRCLGRLQEVVTPSILRVVPKCRHVPHCGGCVWQQMDYQAQLACKQLFVEKAFASLLQDTQVYPIIPCLSPWYYRNKMEFSFSQDRKGNRFLGLYSSEEKQHVLAIQECYLISPWVLGVVEEVRLWWEETGLHAYHPRKDQGSLRTLTCREGKRTGDKLVMLTVSGNPQFALNRSQLESFVSRVQKALSQVEKQERVGIFLRIQQLQGGQPTQFYELHLAGPEYLQEELEISVKGEVKRLKVQMSPTAFFQPNSLQAEKLYARGAELLEWNKDTFLLDLYCGIGTVGLAMAFYASKVLGIEINPYAVFDAEANRSYNGLDHVEFLCGDVGKLLESIREDLSLTKPDIIVVDPPRSGLELKALETIQAIGAPQLLYISCNPVSQAKDVALLCQAGYRLVALQPVDQFPHTVHIENLAVLRKG